MVYVHACGEVGTAQSQWVPVTKLRMSSSELSCCLRSILTLSYLNEIQNGSSGFITCVCLMYVRARHARAHTRSHAHTLACTRAPEDNLRFHPLESCPLPLMQVVLLACSSPMRLDWLDSKLHRDPVFPALPLGLWVLPCQKLIIFCVCANEYYFLLIHFTNVNLLYVLF